ncbi:hypothetical protein MLIT_14710 [Mycolicibacterium litorale]|uniref:Uncharacterized protein n=1 Tax=Mycolicibacterium litorale TaxID=758802 RepID=A0AAD1II54_9MYCO|nr:hypothetical protein MLIT_14710 [Mycolicibacterium litorale]
MTEESISGERTEYAAAPVDVDGVSADSDLLLPTTPHYAGRIPDISVIPLVHGGFGGCRPSDYLIAPAVSGSRILPQGNSHGDRGAGLEASGHVRRSTKMPVVSEMYNATVTRCATLADQGGMS